MREARERERDELRNRQLSRWDANFKDRWMGGGRELRGRGGVRGKRGRLRERGKRAN